uniref:Nedd4 family interacting protein 1, like n=1 Tax=Salmo trutta TaxID=8032 RepID=A0A673Z2T7_SALTR
MKRSQRRLSKWQPMPHPLTAALQKKMQLILTTKKMGVSPSHHHTTWPQRSLPMTRRSEPRLKPMFPWWLEGCGRSPNQPHFCFVYCLHLALEDEDFVARDDFEDADQLRIGNDGIFMLTFFMAFLFNWIGFFLSFCLTTSAAGRYGAISGFGLSLIKWILIVRFSTYFPGYFDGQYWLWWVFLVLGFLLFLRGFINYAKIRKMADSFSSLPRTRVLFIY